MRYGPRPRELQPCDHVGWERVEHELVEGPGDTEYGVEWLTCWCCGARLPLAPANDRGVPAREMELAEAIARWPESADSLVDSAQLLDGIDTMIADIDARYDRSQRKQRTRRRSR